MSTPPPSRKHELRLRLRRSAPKIIGIAFGAGLLLFLAVWWAGRGEAFYTVPSGDKTSGPGTSQETGLPTPLSADRSVSGMKSPRKSASMSKDDAARLLEADPAAPSNNDAKDTSQPVMSGPSAIPLASGDTPVPIQGQNPAPRYPAAAMRRQQSGTVTVRVQVDTLGNPASVALMTRSGSRELDRAAMEAVRRWKFHPAQRDGKATSGSVDIPFEFNIAR